MSDTGFDTGHSPHIDVPSVTKENGVTRQQQWTDTEKKIKDIEDKYAFPIDTDVRELVVGLNAFDIPTRLSCEGHIDHTGTKGPFVTVGRVHVSHIENADTERQTAEKNREDFNRLTGYLTDFYTDRPVSPEAQLVLDEENDPFAKRLNGGFLHNRGQVDFQLGMLETEQMDPEAAAEKSQTLQAFQTEIKDFGTFLKTEFLNS